jgi:hypothetical protein
MSKQAFVIDIGVFTGNSVANLTFTSEIFSLANSTANLQLAPGSFWSGNSTQNVVIGTKDIAATGNVAGDTLVATTLITGPSWAAGANVGANTTALKAGTLVITTGGISNGANSAFVKIDLTTSVNVGANVSIDLTRFFAGNSTVNSSMNSSSLVINGIERMTPNTSVAAFTRFATAAEYLAGAAANGALNVAEVWLASNTVPLTDGATITPDFNTGINFSVTLGGNRAMANPTNPKVGQAGSIYITQDGTGSRTLSWGANWDWAGGTAPVLSTAASARDVINYKVITATSIYATIAKAIA